MRFGEFVGILKSQKSFFYSEYTTHCTSFLLKLCLISSALIISTHTTAQSQSNVSRSTVESTLSNGLRVIIREDHRAPIVLSQIWYAVGSADESGNVLGVSHVLEHMMFKGTKKVPNDEFTRLSRNFGGSINAFTSTNYTNYYQLYPKQYFPLALELEADRMHNLMLRQQDFEPEIKVVMEERRQRTDDNPRNLAFERFKWIAYPTSHYRQPIIGLMKNLNNIQLQDLKDWYQRWYTPNNATLVIVGDVNPEATLKQVEKYFGAIPKSALPQRNDVLEFDRLGYRQLEMNMPVQIPNLYMAWNVKSLNTAKNPQDAYALTIIQSLLDGGISSRLQDRLVRDRKILTSINVSYDPYNRGDSLFIISAIPAENVSLETAQKNVQAEMDLFKTELVNVAELDGVKSNFVSNLVYSQDDIAGQAKMIGQLAVNGIDYRLLDQLPKHYQTVTSEDLKRIANIYFVRENLSVLHLMPESAQ